MHSLVSSVCLSADGQLVLSGGHEHLALWELATGKCLRAFTTSFALGTIWAVCLSGDGRFALCAGFAGLLRLWDTGKGERLLDIQGHTGQVNSVCVSSDDRFVLSGGNDKTLRLWELPSGKCLRALEGHTNFVKSVCLSADCRYALSGSADNTVRLWLLDWELVPREPADWDEAARPYLARFLTLHTPYAGELPRDRTTEADITRALTRTGKPTWTSDDFQQLLDTLGCAGYGWLKPEGVRRELEKMTAR
jgi:hypothetical protein